MNQQDEAAILSVVANANQHKDKWDECFYMTSSDHLLAVLVQEVGELALALEGKHEHPPELELIQIGGIAINWLRQFDSEKVLLALATTTKEHSQKAPKVMKR